MKYVRVQGLHVSFQHDGALLVRAPGLARAARVPPPAIAVLSFCSQPRTGEQVRAVLGPAGVKLYEGLVDVGLLVEPRLAAETRTMFEGFARVDVHRRMIEDTHRVAAYRAALEELVEPGSVVLDAGTGTGLLAILAARAGARKVYAVDNSDLLDLARLVVEDSGLSDTIELVRGDFGAIEIPDTVDVIVTETYGAFALAEGSPADLDPCVRRHLAPDGHVIPSEISLWMAPVLDAGLLERCIGVFDSVPGVDLRAVRDMAEAEAWITTIEPEALLHPGRVVARLPSTVSYVNGSTRFEGLPPGPLHGLAGWFTLHLSPSVDLPTGPSDPPTHWLQSFFPFTEVVVGSDGVLDLEIEVQPGEADRRGVTVMVDWSTSQQSGRRSWKVR